MKLKDKTALVTGAGSGIGRAIAMQFAEEGARVAVNDVNLDGANETLKEMGASGAGSYAVRADVSSSAEVRRMFAEAGERFGGLDILVNNAGIGETDPDRREEINRKGQARLMEMMAGGKIQTHWDLTVGLSDEQWERVVGTHLNGTFYCTREALKLMMRKNRGAIINISSVAALKGIAVAPHYGAAKGGILSFTRSVAEETASRNIRVNAICPGWVETPMTQMFSPIVKAGLTAQIPMMRWAEPREIAQTALFLASDDSSYYTGQWLSPNGGLFIG